MSVVHSISASASDEALATAEEDECRPTPSRDDRAAEGRLRLPPKPLPARPPTDTRRRLEVRRLAEGAKARTARGPTPANIDESEEKEPAAAAVAMNTERDGKRISHAEETISGASEESYSRCASARGSHQGRQLRVLRTRLDVDTVRPEYEVNVVGAATT